MYFMSPHCRLAASNLHQHAGRQRDAGLSCAPLDAHPAAQGRHACRPAGRSGKSRSKARSAEHVHRIKAFLGDRAASSACSNVSSRHEAANWGARLRLQACASGSP